MSEAADTFTFGPFTLEVSERRLSREGTSIPLRMKVFDTLRVLVENAGRLLTKDELLHAVWPATVVEENNLNPNVSVLRKALGQQATGQAYIETVPRVGYRFAARVERSGPRVSPLPLDPAMRQEIRYRTTADGVRLAYATVGSGPPLVKASNWLTHLDFEWGSPIWRHWWTRLAEHHRVIRYDERGNGMSQRDVGSVSFETWVRDLETVVDAAALDRFALLVVHCDGDRAVPAEDGQELAAMIPGARYVSVPSENHVLLENEPGWAQFLHELGLFLGWRESFSRP